MTTPTRARRRSRSTRSPRATSSRSSTRTRKSRTRPRTRRPRRRTRTTTKSRSSRTTSSTRTKTTTWLTTTTPSATSRMARKTTRMAAAEATMTMTGTNLAAIPPDFLSFLIPDHPFPRMIFCLLLRYMKKEACNCNKTLLRRPKRPQWPRTLKNCQRPKARNCQLP